MALRTLTERQLAASAAQPPPRTPASKGPSNSTASTANSSRHTQSSAARAPGTSDATGHGGDVARLELAVTTAAQHIHTFTHSFADDFGDLSSAAAAPKPAVLPAAGIVRAEAMLSDLEQVCVFVCDGLVEKERERERARE